MNARTPVVLVSTLFSPFQTELATALNEREGLDYHVLYTKLANAARGSHWTEDVRRTPPYVHTVPAGLGARETAAWVEERLATLAPRVIVANGILRAPTWQTLTALRPRLGTPQRRTPVGYWLEHPDLSRPWHVCMAVELMTRVQMGAMDFGFVIGDRAEAYYRRCHPTLPLHVVPYGSNLGPSFAIERNGPPERTRFLFSGQLVARNNIRALTEAFERLAESHAGRFEWVVSASGPEERWITEARARSPVLDRATRFDRDFVTWNDRLRPFAQSDVLVCPSLHAGWALVVPEALAAGMPVIATRAVSAARWFVRPELSGVFVETDANSIYRALVRFVEDHPAIARMGAEARLAAHAGTVEFIAARFAEAARKHAG